LELNNQSALVDAVKAIGGQMQCLNDWLRHWQEAKAVGAPPVLPHPCR
jgi:hypothetical protein